MRSRRITADALAERPVLVVRIALDRYRGDVDVLSPDELARFRRMRSVGKKREYLAGRSAMRRVLAGLVDVDARDVAIENGPHGKPEVGGQGDLHFNLSHSGDRALLAVSRRGPIGVDIEAARTGRPFRRLARRFFSPSEYQWLDGLPTAGVADGFYRVWTLKEAYLKAIGTGLTLSSRDFELDPESDPPRLLGTPPGQMAAEKWAMQVLPVEHGYQAALCAPAGLLDRQVRLSDC